MSAVPATGGAYRSKTVATWLAFVGGAVGLHAWYLHGARPRAEWALPPLALAGLAGVVRMRNLGVDDRISWLLIPLLGIALSVGMLAAIVIGLTPDEKWNARYAASGRVHRTGWPAVIAVIAALMIGGGVLMATVAFVAEHYFRYTLESAAR